MYLAGELSYKLLGWYRHYSVMSTSLLVSSGAVSCYPASMVNLIGFANVYRVSALSNMGTWNQASCDLKTQPYYKLGVLVQCHAWTCESPTIPTDIVAATVKLQKFVISEPDFHHRNRVATDSTSWDYQACTRDTLWRQRYVTTSKEYLINCYILLKYFELVFLQLQLV